MTLRLRPGLNRTLLTAKIFFFCIIAIRTISYGQIDTTFWFAVPFVGTHGNGNADLVLTNISQTNPVTVILTTPANPIGGLPTEGLTWIIPASGFKRIDLSSYFGGDDYALSPPLGLGSLNKNVSDSIFGKGLINQGVSFSIGLL
ncbi:MAG TPA: hypothetical protein VF691_05475 [Cytophagaceae bacterium]|jgi:hypothetical protein